MSARPPLVMQVGTWTTHYALLGRWLMHCGRTWNVRTASDYPSLADAQAAAERRYPGSATRWLRTGYTQARAEAYVERASRGHSCSFCGRRPDQFNEQMFVAKKNAARICDACVDRLGSLRATYRKKQDEQQERLLNTVSAHGPVRFVVRSRVLALLDLATFDSHREALQAMARLDEDGRRRALVALAPRGIAVHEIVPFTPGLYRVRPADLEPVRGRARDIVAADSGAVVLVDLDVLPAVAEALTTALLLVEAFEMLPRFAVLQGRPRRAFSGHGRFRLKPSALVLVSAHT
jgi:hypothetical protein